MNLQNADREELYDVDRFYEKMIRVVKAPIMIDTTDPVAIERALTYCQGKSIINSINLEDGLDKFERVTPLARKYGAALIVGCIDEDKEQAQAITRERKLEIAQRSVKLLTEDYGIRAEDIIFDPLVFPCATGDANYVGSAVETIEGVRLIKQEIPYVKTMLGISNVSFGLAGRGPRSAELGLPLSLHKSRARSGDRQFGESSNATLRSPKKSGILPKTCCGIAATTR